MEKITHTPETYQEEVGPPPEEQTGEDQSRFSWEALSRLMVYLLVGLTPLWFLPTTVFPLELNKAYLAYMLIVASFVFWLLARIQEGRMRLPKNYIALALVALVAAIFLSGLFSISRHVSFFGLGHEEGTVGALTLFSGRLDNLIAFYRAQTYKKLASCFHVVSRSCFCLPIFTQRFGDFAIFANDFCYPGIKPHRQLECFRNILGASRYNRAFSFR